MEIERIQYDELLKPKSKPVKSIYPTRKSEYAIRFPKTLGEVNKISFSRDIVEYLKLSRYDRDIEIMFYKGGVVIFKTDEQHFRVTLIGYGVVNQKKLAQEIYAYMDKQREIPIEAVEKIIVVKGKKEYPALYIHK